MIPTMISKTKMQIKVNLISFHHRFFCTVLAFLLNCFDDSATASTGKDQSHGDNGRSSTSLVLQIVEGFSTLSGRLDVLFHGLCGSVYFGLDFSGLVRVDFGRMSGRLGWSYGDFFHQGRLLVLWGIGLWCLDRWITWGSFVLGLFHFLLFFGSPESSHIKRYSETKRHNKGLTG